MPAPSSSPDPAPPEPPPPAASPVLPEIMAFLTEFGKSVGLTWGPHLSGSVSAAVREVLLDPVLRDTSARAFPYVLGAGVLFGGLLVTNIAVMILMVVIITRRG